ncbi:TPA: hypothetical protein DEP21_04210 [Patescibacteria group bacterium]|nr:hypothetical protein [Candidatus Gracilibacteria bacterium]
MKTSDIFDIFCSTLHIIQINELDSYLDQKYINTTTKQVIQTTHLPFQKNIYTQIKKYVNNGDQKIDIITLFHISL